MSDNTVHIAAFAGSIRADSFNRHLLRIAEQHLPMNATLEILDLSAIPMFNADVEKAGFPSEVVHFRAKLRDADAILIATPEYNISIPGVLKNAIDWASRGENGLPGPLNLKPVAIMGAGGRTATARAQSHLRQITNHLNMYTINKPEVIISMVPNQPFDAAGNLNDPAAHQLIAELLRNLVTFTQKIKAPITASYIAN
jgi:chromate reductase